MGSKRSFNNHNPALILVHGNTGKRHRLLDQDVLVIGRARGCDLGLDAPDISNVHCVIARRPEGFRIRDCGSRSGTRINGHKIREQRLEDGDMLQVGPFCFRLHLPSAPGPIRSAADEQLLQRLQRSRRKFAKLALRQRQRLLQQPQLPAQMGEEASALCVRVREYEQRLGLLEEGERDLSRDREVLSQEQRQLQHRLRLFDEEMAERRAALEAAAAEQQQVEEQRQAAEISTSALLLEQQRLSLEQERNRLLQWQEDLTRRFLELQTEQFRIDGIHETWRTIEAEVITGLECQNAALQEIEQAFRNQHASLVATVEEWKQLHGGICSSLNDPAGPR